MARRITGDWPDLERYSCGPYADLAMNVPLDKLPWSVNCLAAFRDLQLKLIGDLCAKTARELLLVRNFGRASLDEIELTLLQKKLKLGMSVEREQQ